MNEINDKIVSVDRAFQIINLLSVSQKSMGISSIVAALKLPKVTAFRILTSLVENDVLIKHEDDTYSLGVALVAFGECAKSSFNAKSLAEPYIKELCTELGETVSLSIYYNHSSLDVFSVDGEASFITMKFSPIADLYVCASGKLFLSHMNDEDIKKYFEISRPKRTENTINTYDAFIKEKSRILENGISYETEEFEYGYYSAAVPVYGAENSLICSVQMSAPLSRIKRTKQSFIDDSLKSTADKISTLYKKALISHF